jgi:hypothetical protein
MLASRGNVLAKGLQSSYSDPWAAAAIGQPVFVTSTLNRLSVTQVEKCSVWVIPANLDPLFAEYGRLDSECLADHTEIGGLLFLNECKSPMRSMTLRAIHLAEWSAIRQIDGERGDYRFTFPESRLYIHRQIAQGSAKGEDCSAVCMARRPSWRNVSHNSAGR